MQFTQSSIIKTCTILQLDDNDGTQQADHLHKAQYVQIHLYNGGSLAKPSKTRLSTDLCGSSGVMGMYGDSSPSCNHNFLKSTSEIIRDPRKYGAAQPSLSLFSSPIKSKAFQRSKKTAPISSPLSSVFSQSYVVDNSSVTSFQVRNHIVTLVRGTKFGGDCDDGMNMTFKKFA